MLFEWVKHMWTREILGTDIYHLFGSFIIYSILGWFVESIYMSFCNHKITNRGFAKGPFCPIYGFGCNIGYFLLVPFRKNFIHVYLVGAVFATTFEFLSGLMMIRLLGDLWWDYNDKFLNYKGIICLESTLAWGLYGWIVLYFLQGKIMQVIDLIDMHWGLRIFFLIMFVVLIDYIFQLKKVFEGDAKDKVFAYCKKSGKETSEEE